MQDGKEKRKSEETSPLIISNVIQVIYQKVYKRQRYKSYAVQGVNEEGRMLAFLGLLHGCHTNSHHHNIRCTSTKQKGKIQTLSLSELSDLPAVPFNICHRTDTWGTVGQSPIQKSPLSNSPIIVTIVLKPGLRISIVENLESRVSMRFHSREQYRVLNLQYRV